MSSKHKRLGDILMETGLLSEDQLKKALVVQKKTGERLGKVLINLDYITEESMIEVLEFQLGIPHVNLSDTVVKEEVAALIPVSLAERYQIIPIKQAGKKLTLAMVDPTNFFAIDDVRMITGCDVEAVIAAAGEVKRAINQSYGVSQLVEKAVHKLQSEESAGTVEFQATDDAPIVSIVNSLIHQAIKERASDIHIEPQDKSVRVRFRVDGMLREVAAFPRHTLAALISRIKIMSQMDIAERRLPQDGRIKFTETGREIDIRTSTLPTILGEKVVMRILDKKSVILDIKALGMSAANLNKYHHLYTRSHGMILVTGPTGSGKTTTLYSTLTDINSPSKNIITVEDPVEYRLEGVNQVQVNYKAGLNFADGLKSILRQDPNIIMVGEIRDGETADIAIRAALTGHLVLSTLHTNDAPGAIARLIDMGIEPFLVASSVLGVMAQRLVRVICPDCKQKYIPSPDSPERLFLQLTPAADITLYRGAGCPRCNNTGYRGRMAIHELMPVSLAIRDLINCRAGGDQLAAAAVKEGMLTMGQDGIRKALEGLTTIEEVMRVAYSDIAAAN
ncbi:MAG: ATPase, T2SS/T4P/T4SS family [Veillonellales bacterium]